MTTPEVANRLLELCRAGKVEQAKDELFADDVVSIEPREGLLPVQSKGMPAIRRKAELFISTVDEFYGDTISEPLIAGNFFALVWTSELKMKGEPRQTNTELCVYEVREGRIISEQFFY